MSAPTCDRIESGTPVYLTIQDVAGMLQCDPTTVYRIASSDVTFPALRVGGLVRVERDALLVWLQARTQGARRAQRRAHGA